MGRGGEEGEGREWEGGKKYLFIEKVNMSQISTCLLADLHVCSEQPVYAIFYQRV